MKNTTLFKLLEDRGGQRRIDYSLDRLRRALDSIGNPERTVYSLVISGTNGKGTTTLLISSALKEAGYHVGTFLSPHLISPTERFLENLIPINEEELTTLAVELNDFAQRYDLTYFELLALVYFVWAKRKAFDFSVLEVGLGGRLDATNVTDPLASIITNIAFDHQSYLGNTLESILTEKMGIMRPEGLVFTGISDSGLRQRLETRCTELDAIWYNSNNVRTEVLSRTWEGQSITLNGHAFELSNPSIGTVDNAALAFLVMRIVFPKIPVSALRQAFRQINTPARLEIVSNSPRIILSGDHNPAGLKNMIASLSGLLDRKPFVVCAFSPDKPFVEMAETLRAFSEQIIFTEIKEIRDQLPPAYRQLTPYEPDADKAIDKMLAHTTPCDTLLITGSLYLAGEVRPRWRPRVEFWKDHPITQK